jgi:hypothetical protein
MKNGRLTTLGDKRVSKEKIWANSATRKVRMRVCPIRKLLRTHDSASDRFLIAGRVFGRRG